ncbi:nucleic acid-binding protein [Spirochaetia bacterium]|nr:nucleic acid-binding protein [Spirochaetia bacterium]
MYFLDSNICLYYLKNRYPPLSRKLTATAPDKIKIPSIVEAEIFTGVEKGARQTSRELWEEFFAPFEIVPFDHEAAGKYALIRASLEQNGTIIGPNDLIIAATVMAKNGILVSHNTGEFKRIPGLSLEDWTEG